MGECTFADLACGRTSVDLKESGHWEVYGETYFQGGRTGPISVIGYSTMARGSGIAGEIKWITCAKTDAPSCEDFNEYNATCSTEKNAVALRALHVAVPSGTRMRKTTSAQSSCDPNQEQGNPCYNPLTGLDDLPGCNPNGTPGGPSGGPLIDTQETMSYIYTPPPPPIDIYQTCKTTDWYLSTDGGYSWTYTSSDTSCNVWF